MGNKFGWHSGVLTAKDGKFRGDLYVQDDIVFSDVSAGTLGVTGGIDLGGSTSAIGLDMADITCSTAAIDIQGTGLTGRAIRIGVKDTGLKISTGGTLDQEPANNYLFGLFTAVTATEATSTDELRSAWIRTRVNANMDIGSNAGWGYGVCGAEVQLKFYGGTTKVYAWQNSALWAQLESQASSGTNTFQSGSYTQCVLANIGLTSATLASGAVIAGVTINANTATLTNTGNAYYGLFITDKNTTSTDFTSGIWIADSVATTGITIGTCTTGILLDGTITTGIVMEPSAMTNGIIIGTPNTASGYGLKPNMTDSWSVGAPVSFYFDDGGTAITAWGECFTVGFVVTANSTAAAQTGWPYTAFFYKDIQANITSATNQHWATVLMNTSIASAKTVDGFDSHGLSTLHLSADVNGTLAAGTTLANLSFGGNSPGTISGTWVPIHVRDTTGDFSAFLKLDTNATGCYTATPLSGGTAQYLKVLIADKAYTIEMATAA